MATKSSAKKTKKEEAPSLRELADAHVQDPESTEDPAAAPSVATDNPDNYAQRFEAALQAAIPLQQEVAGAPPAPENGSQHYLATQYADEGKPYPPEAEDPDELVAARDEATAKAEKQQAKAALKAFDSIDDDDLVVAHRREDTPTRPEQGFLDDEYFRPHSIMGAQPQVGAIVVGTLVSRHDEAHDEIGVVSEVDKRSQSYPLVKVEFPTEGTAWLSPSNVRIEGDALELAGTE